jgi:valyl-tRNA synthetase
MPRELAPTYDPKSAEPEIWKLWEAGGHFHAPADPGREKFPRGPFTIVIPPPNVTGALHMGHALNNTLQDILIRRRRMQGFNALWMPGTDHAGIATQSVVEKQLKQAEGKTRHDLGREELVRRIWAWKEQYGGRIIEQLKRMGCSCDWERTRFTLDDVCARAVRQAFFDLFKGGYIYRGKRLVNWDPALQTAVADDELDDRTVQGNFYYIKYPLVGGDGHVTVATTRPETMLGDTAVAINPKDPRAAALVGRKAILPLLNREIPIIADDYVVLPDPNSADDKARLATGFLKVTPAHDPNDYDIGLRHKLEMINIFNPDATVNDNGGPYRGLDRYAARKKVCADLEALGLLEKSVPYTHTVPHSDRSGAAIEPYLSDQWFVKMGDRPQPDGSTAPGLARIAMDAVTSGKVKFFPERYAKTYLDWLGAKRDWCISRQLWWGHRIPVWHHCGDAAGFNRALAALSARLKGDFRRQVSSCRAPTQEPALGLICALHDLPQDLCAEYGLVQDPDVLDTWFSSALWPFSTLGWPEKTPELATFYPGDVLITSRGIITLWVARMVMAGLMNCGRVPFRDVIIHATILDAFGEPMSKSKGNGVDPVDIINKQGADGMRFTLASMATETQDIRLPIFYECPHCGDWESNPLRERHKKPATLTDACGKCKKTFTLPKTGATPTADAPQAAAFSDKFDFGRNFCNKLWNAARFALMSLGTAGPSAAGGGQAPEALRIEDSWILARLNECIRAVDEGLEKYRFADAAGAAYTFFWDEFCAWYLEIAKPRLRGDADGVDRAVARRVLGFVLDASLRLLHPFAPFVTEYVWGFLREAMPRRSLFDAGHGEDGPILKAAWPAPVAAVDAGATATFELLRDIVRAVRNIRNKFKIAPGRPVDVVIRTHGAIADAIFEHGAIVRQLAGVNRLTAGPAADKPAGAATEVSGDMQVFVPLEGLMDLVAERKKLAGEREKTAAGLAQVEAKLSNEAFASKARPEVIEKERARRDELKGRLEAIDRSLAEMK